MTGAEAAGVNPRVVRPRFSLDLRHAVLAVKAFEEC